MDRGFSFTVTEEPGKVSEIVLAEASMAAVGSTRGQPVEIWRRGESPSKLTNQRGTPEQVLVSQPSLNGGVISFPLMWRTAEGDVHSGYLRISPRPEHRRLLARIGHDLATIPGFFGCVAVDVVLIAAIIPVAIIVLPVAASH